MSIRITNCATGARSSAYRLMSCGERFKRLDRWRTRSSSTFGAAIRRGRQPKSPRCLAVGRPSLLGVPGLPTPADLCHPMIARVPFTREGWIFELKHDGFRALARKDRTRVQLLSRSGQSMATAFPEVMDALAKLPSEVVLDAELIAPTLEGRSDFEE